MKLWWMRAGREVNCYAVVFMAEGIRAEIKVSRVSGGGNSPRQLAARDLVDEPGR